MATAIAFPDANCFLHYRSIEELDWLVLLKADSVVLVVTPTLIRDLNKQKDGGSNKRIRKRAASAIKKLAGFLERSPATIREGVELRSRPHDPLIDFPAHKLNDKLSDDWLLGTILEFRGEFPDSRVVIVTNDLGLKLKAVAHGVESFELPENYALPDEPDPDKVRIQELERELVTHKRNTPDLRVTFEDGGDYLRVRLTRAPLIAEEEILRETDTVKQLHPKAPKATIYPAAVSMLGGIGPLDIDRHNLRMDLFYTAYENYLRATQEFEDSNRRLFQLDIALANLGFSPALDIDVYMHVPDGLRVSTELESLLKQPDEPKVPEGPKSVMEERVETLAGVGGITIPSALIDTSLTRFPALGSNVSSLKIRRTNSFEIRNHVRELKHNLQVKIGRLFGLFDSWETARSFHIEFELLAANVPEPVEGQLHVVIEVVESAK